jgi:hypothetical protein
MEKTMLRIPGFLLAGLLALSLSGCTTMGPQFTTAQPVSENEAMLYVYRPHTYAFIARIASIDVNGKRAVGLKNNGYAAIKLKPGEYEITQRWDEWLFLDHGKFDSRPLKATLNLAPGTTTYVRLTANVQFESTYTNRYVHSKWELTKMSETHALLELEKTKRADLEAEFAR